MGISNRFQVTHGEEAHLPAGTWSASVEPAHAGVTVAAGGAVAGAPFVAAAGKATTLALRIADGIALPVAVEQIVLRRVPQ